MTDLSTMLLDDLGRSVYGFLFAHHLNGRGERTGKMIGGGSDPFFYRTLRVPQVPEVAVHPIGCP